MLTGSWRSTVSPQWQDVPRRRQDPPDEDGGACEMWACPRTGSEHDGLILCSFHRGDDTVRARHKTPGPRSNDT